MLLYLYNNKYGGDKMLNLKEFKTMNKQVNDYYYLFNIEAKEKPTVCPMCNAVDVALRSILVEKESYQMRLYMVNQ